MTNQEHKPMTPVELLAGLRSSMAKKLMGSVERIIKRDMKKCKDKVHPDVVKHLRKFFLTDLLVEIDRVLSDEEK